MKLEKLLPWNANAPPHRETNCETRNRPLFHILDGVTIPCQVWRFLYTQEYRLEPMESLAARATMPW